MDNVLSLNTLPCTSRGLNHTRWLLLVIGILLLAAGGWIYVSSRPGTLIYHLCHPLVGEAHGVTLSDFMLYCMPNGLWSLSSILILHALLAQESMLRRVAIVSVVPVLGIASEIMQAAGLLNGVFDLLDIACYAIPLLLYIFIQFISKPKLIFRR